MALTHFQFGAIVSGCSGAVLLVIILVFVFVHPVRCFTFSHRKYPYPIPISMVRDEENQRLSTADNGLVGISSFENIGNLTISPSCRPLPSALDIGNHVAMAIALPVGVKPAKLEGAPRVSLHLLHLAEVNLTKQVNINMAEAVIQEQKAKDEADVALPRAEPGATIEKCSLDLGLENCSTEQLGKTRDVYFVDDDNDDGPENVHPSNHKTTHSFGSSKAMAALYHAV